MIHFGMVTKIFVCVRRCVFVVRVGRCVFGLFFVSDVLVCVFVVCVRR